jgi:putative nucleotidyltransferase with HDIG domain
MAEVDHESGRFLCGISLAQLLPMEHALAPPSNLHGRVRKLRMPSMGRIEEANKELWLLLSIFGICLVLNYALASQRMVLSLYTFPTLVSAYVYGRRHATLTAFASVLIVVLLQLQNPSLRLDTHVAATMLDEWLDVIAWGSVLMITGYSMGTLYEHRSAQLLELRETYNGVLMLLRHFISKDKYTENHCYRVSVYAAHIAARLQLDQNRIEDVRAAALLHDIGKLDISRELLYKAAKLTNEEYEEIKQHVSKGIGLLEPVGGSLRRVIPIVLAHHDKFDGSGYHPTRGDAIPIEARIISVADVYDSLTSDRPYRKAMSPFEARDIIVKGSETEFDPKVVAAFQKAFRLGRLEVWSAPISAA